MEEGRSWYYEDPTVEGRITFCWVYKQKFWAMWCSNREGIKDDR